MKKSVNIVNNVIMFAITLVAVVFETILVNKWFPKENMLSVVFVFIASAIIAGFVNAYVHEKCHAASGRKNGFDVLTMTVWFFKWTYRGKRREFDLCMIGDEAGYTESVPKTKENLDIRLKKMTKAGIIGSFVMLIISIGLAALIFVLPCFYYCVFAMFLPVSVYYFLGSVLPMSAGGVLNDGGTVRAINKKTPSIQVELGVMALQAEMYQGKTPSEIDESMYNNLPQLPEDDLNFIFLLSEKYAYYLDKEDFENAKKMTKRLMGLADNLPKNIKYVIYADALYNACTFDFNEERADALMYELDKYINNVNNGQNIRAKLAYLLYVLKDREPFETFYDKGIREAEKCRVEGMGKFEKKLLLKMKEDYEKTEKEDKEKTE